MASLLRSTVIAAAIFSVALANSAQCAQLVIFGTWTVNPLLQTGGSSYRFDGTETGTWSYAFEYSGAGPTFTIDASEFSIAGYEFTNHAAGGDRTVDVSQIGANSSAVWDVDFAGATSGPGALGDNSAILSYQALRDGTFSQLDQIAQGAFQAGGTLTTTDNVGTIEAYQFNLTGVGAFVPEPNTVGLIVIAGAGLFWSRKRRNRK